jgi:hypothetical protein
MCCGAVDRNLAQRIEHRRMTGRDQIKEEGAKLKIGGEKFKAKKKQLSGFLLKPKTKFNGKRFNVDIF